MDAADFPAIKLDRLDHNVYIYESSLTVEVESKERIEINKIYTGGELMKNSEH